MSLPSNFPKGGELTPMIVIDRGDGLIGPPDPSQSGRVKYKSPLIHGTSVSDDDLPLSIGTQAPNGGSQCTFAGVPDLGTFVMTRKETGRTDVVASDLPYGFVNSSDSGTPGNFGLLQQFLSFFSKPDGRMRPPDVYETMENGAKVKKIREKGPRSYNDTQGIATHAAYSQIAGSRVPQVRNVPTAVQAVGNILTDAQAGNIAGVAMSIGSILASVLSNPVSRSAITKNMSPQTINALNSMSIQSQSCDTLATGGSVSGTRVNPNVFSGHCVNMLSNCNSPADILNTLTELSLNTAYHGLDEEDLILTLESSSSRVNFMIGDTIYQASNEVPGTDSVPIGKVIAWNPNQQILELNIENGFDFVPEEPIFSMDENIPDDYIVEDHQYFVTGNTALSYSNTSFGTTSTYVDSRGNVRQSPSNQSYQAAQAFATAMSVASSFPSALNGVNLFGSGSSTMLNMMQRISTNPASAISMLTNISAPSNIIRFAIQQITLNQGGNPFKRLQ